jgi:LmbE family N-acetylglucosaminyl deacetylase
VNASELSNELRVPEVALAIGAHPDDIEFGCGATLAKWAEAGAEVHLLILTDGSKGSWDESDDLAALIARRREEAQAAASRLGAAAVRFLDYADGELESGATERVKVVETIRIVRPDTVLGHDPWKRYRLHPDHRHAGWLTIDGIVAARDPHFFPGVGGAHHRPSALLLFEADAPNHLELVSGTIPHKIAALLEHRSQWRSTHGIEVGTPAEQDGIAAFEARIEADARVDAPPGTDELVEAFHLVTEL